MAILIHSWRSRMHQDEQNASPSWWLLVVQGCYWSSQDGPDTPPPARQADLLRAPPIARDLRSPLRLPLLGDTWGKRRLLPGRLTG